MDAGITNQQMEDLLYRILSLRSEREHIELKVNNYEPNTIAENIVGITNYLTESNTPRGYMIWGVSDGFNIIGTKFSPYEMKIGNESLLLWLSKYIKPEPHLTIKELNCAGKRVVVIVVGKNSTEMSSFKGKEYLRIGANTRNLKNYPAKRKAIWNKILISDFEISSAKSCLSKETVTNLLDFEAFFKMRQNRVPVEKDILFDEAISCGIIIDNKDTTYDITNLGALLYAKDLGDFSNLADKSVRIISYIGNSRLETKEERRSVGGYVAEFNSLHKAIMDATVDKEEIGADGLQKVVHKYPNTTIRELLANIITHQDLTNSSIHPMVEIFEDRIEFTNAGIPLVPKERFVDYPPQTRNHKIAEELFKVAICESRGSGWDKVAFEASSLKFPAPKPEIIGATTRVTLLQRKNLADMTTEQRLWSIYIYACLLWTKNEFLTNSSIRELFDIPKENITTASFLLSSALKAGYIKIFDEKAGNRNRKYLPCYSEDEII